MIAGRRVLLLLDNAADESQVHPLLPGTDPSPTIVTSRQPLAGPQPSTAVTWPCFGAKEAVELLTRIIGPDRVGAEEQTARGLADLCGHLPPAVRIAGPRLPCRPHERLHKLVARLTAGGRRLDGLQAGNLRIRAAFALSCRQLRSPSRTFLRRATPRRPPERTSAPRPAHSWPACPWTRRSTARRN